MTTANSEKRDGSGKLIGHPLDRIDGRLKVTGKAQYAAEWNIPGLVHGVIIQSTITRGTITRFASNRAEELPGVLAVYSHLNKPAELSKMLTAKFERLSLLQDSEVHYAGQIIGLVVADTLETAKYAASLLEIDYETSDFSTDLNSRLSQAFKPVNSGDEERGKFKKAFETAEVKLDVTYCTQTQTHNPIEPFGVIAQWDGDNLTIYDSTQALIDTQRTMAEVLSLSPNAVRVISPFVGGGFGAKLSVWSHLPLAALAARKLGKPVKISLVRSQMYGAFGCRPATVQTVKIGAGKDGKLKALEHQGINETAEFVDFIECVADGALQSYYCENVKIGHQVVRLNIGEPTWMRAPGHATGSIALECAMDELAHQLAIDPIELRLRNFAEMDPQSGLPWSSNNLRECYRRGAELFGWSRRNGAPGTIKEDRLLIGCGMATALHPMEHTPASVRVKLTSDGFAVVQTASQDIGTGTYTIMTQIAADALSLPAERIKLQLGDSSFPKAAASGGSSTAGSVGSAVKQACTAVLEELISVAVSDKKSPLCALKRADIQIDNGRLAATDDSNKSEDFFAVVSRTASKEIESTVTRKPGPELQKFSVCAFGAHFAEVAVDPDLGQIRVRKFYGAYDIGRVLNHKTARSQIIGGIVFGMGLALMEHTWIDQNLGRIINADIAEYHVPVHPDIGDLHVEFIPTDDPYANAVGAKGAGELGITGAAAAIANAVFNATGKRIRNFPITLDYFM